MMPELNEYIGNRGGVPIVLATQTSAGSTTTNASYTFPSHCFRFVGSKGIMVADFSADTASSVTGVTITTNQTSLALLGSSGTALTDLSGGLHLLVFDKQANTLKLLV